MTDKEILQKAIDKAILNGYKLNKVKKIIVLGHPHSQKPFRLTINPMNKKDALLAEYAVESIVFSHKLAKKLWGKNHYVRYEEGFIDPNELYTQKDRDDYECNWIRYQPLWQYHLQKMVLKENPIKYLEQFL